MAVPSIRSLNMQDIKSFGNLARTNLFQVTINGVGSGTVPAQDSFATFLSLYSQKYGVPSLSSQFKDQLSILCHETSLPTSSYATAEVKDNFIGVPQEFAHTRITTDIDFSFYIDRDYKVLMFFEAWMDYISGAGELAQVQSNGSPTPGYYRRFKYPDYYKTDSLYIKKFERDWSATNATNISYQFINAFPKNVTSIPITYGEAEILKVTVTMNYDRYISRREYTPNSIPTTTLDLYNSDGTLQQTATLTAPNSETGATGTLAQLANQGVFGEQ